MVRKDEGVNAVRDGGDGVWFYKGVIGDVEDVVDKEGVVVFEIGDREGEDVRGVVLE